MTTIAALDRFTRSYLETALWSSIDEQPDGNGGPPMDEKYSPEDLHPSALAQAVRECAAFQEANADLLGVLQDAACCGIDDCGGDFWLTRNGHGTGFWDRTEHESGQQLTDLAHAAGSRDLYVGDDGRLYFSPSD